MMNSVFLPSHKPGPGPGTSPARRQGVWLKLSMGHALSLVNGLKHVAKRNLFVQLVLGAELCMGRARTGEQADGRSFIDVMQKTAWP